MEDVIEKMRKDVSVEVAKGETFRFSFVYTDPKKAMQVVQTISDSFTDANRVDRSTVAASTTLFLGRQLLDARTRLEEQERKIADFQRNHAGQLPSERDANLQVMHNLQLQVQTLFDSMNRDRDRRLFLERVLADLEPQAQTARKNVQDAQGNTAEGPAARLAAGTAAEQLENARETLKGMEIHLKPEHPDIQYMKRLIADLEVKAKAEAAAPPSATTRPPRPRNQEEANTLRRIQEAKEEIAAVDIQIASKQAEEKRLRAEIAGFQGRVAATPGLEAEYTSLTRDYETVRMAYQSGRIAATPGLEADYTAMTRDYETLRLAYQSLLAKQEDSKIAKNLVDEKIGETFKTLDDGPHARGGVQTESPHDQPGRLSHRPRHRARPGRAPRLQGQGPPERRRRAGGAAPAGAGNHPRDRVRQGQGPQSPPEGPVARCTKHSSAFASARST